MDFYSDFLGYEFLFRLAELSLDALLLITLAVTSYLEEFYTLPGLAFLFDFENEDDFISFLGEFLLLLDY